MSLKLHELVGDPGNKQKKRRVGRGEGSGWGRCSGKGEKGQQSRSGGGKGPYFEGGQMPLIRRIPKFGFSTKPWRLVRAEITLDLLNKFDEGTIVNVESLREGRYIPKRAQFIKVVATGQLTRKLNVKLNGYSAKAREAIEAAGGTCETV